MSLMSVNLNLMPVLRELLRTRSVSASAQVLGRSPSAISEGLTQLRLTFNDPLLVRTGGQMVLTPKATTLVTSVENICAELERLVRQDHFDPYRTERVFVIAAPDYYSFIMGPRMLSLFARLAPGFSFRFVDISRALADQLTDRTVDVAFLPDFHLGELASARLHHQRLTEDQTVVLMRKGHPLEAYDAIGEDHLLAFTHIAYHPSWESIDRRSVLLAFRHRFKVVARTAHLTQVPFLLASTDHIALAPLKLCQQIDGPLGLIHRPLVQAEPFIRSVVAWSPVQDADRAHAWFRAMLASHLI